MLDGPVSDYTLDGKLLMEGNYSMGKKQGEFRFYYPNGKPESSGNYNDTKRRGDWRYYFPDGSVKTIANFTGPQPEMDFSILEHYDAVGRQTIKDGNGTWQIDTVTVSVFDKESTKTLKGTFKNGKKHGTWTLTRNTESRTIHTEQFKNGEFIVAQILDPQNNFGKMRSETMVKFADAHATKFRNTESFRLDNTTYPESLKAEDVTAMLQTITGQTYSIKNRPASYPDGEFALMQYIGINVKYPVPALRKKEQGTVYVNVTISPEGKATAVNILKGISKELDAEATRVLQTIPTWLPELQDSKPISSTITIPVTFRML